MDCLKCGANFEGERCPYCGWIPEKKETPSIQIPNITIVNNVSNEQNVQTGRECANRTCRKKTEKQPKKQGDGNVFSVSWIFGDWGIEPLLCWKNNQWCCLLAYNRTLLDWNNL